MSVTALLGATLGTVSGVLTLCGLSLLCKSCKKGKLEKGDETDPERAKPSILHTLTQVRLTLTHSHTAMDQLSDLTFKYIQKKELIKRTKNTNRDERYSTSEMF